jgi:hypothetical protein
VIFSGTVMQPMVNTDIRFTSLPKTQPPSSLVSGVAPVFRKHEAAIATGVLKKGSVDMTAFNDCVKAQLFARFEDDEFCQR